MSDISYNNIVAASDTALMERLGAFIKHNRLLQNKTQEQLAKEAGIVRSTLSLLERGQNTSLLVFIQVIRGLKLLNMLQEFEIKHQISPLELARLEQSKKIRAKQKSTGKEKQKNETDW